MSRLWRRTNERRRKVENSAVFCWTRNRNFNLDRPPLHVFCPDLQVFWQIYSQPRITAPRALVSEKNAAPRTKHRARCPYVAHGFILMGHQARCFFPTLGHWARCFFRYSNFICRYFLFNIWVPYYQLELDWCIFDQKLTKCRPLHF